ncbi:MAG TPA: nucleotidyltransferase domain-containing protein [Methanothrix sp.]|nr:nucleotidyltransferase domain-containing protein [Methanothrix sp.]
MKDDDLLTADQQKADAFLEEFVGELGKALGSEIDFILLFGSAARGEFILGKSDVDLVIQAKSDAAVRNVEQLAELLFWRLDEKHGTQFKRVVSTGEGGSLLEDALKFLETQARLYKPFEVFGPDDIDWRSGKIKRLNLLPGATLVASQLTLFYKMKHEGKILFGRDIRPEIKPRFTWWEKLKAIWAAQSIAFASVILALLLPQKAVGYAVKALFYEVDSVNIIQRGMVPPGQEKMASFASATKFQENVLDDVRFFLEKKLGLLSEQKIQLLRRAAQIKREGFCGGRMEALYFSLTAFGTIWQTNAVVILKAGAGL